MITREHAQEQLSRAYITAVAAHARYNVKFNAGFDYGVDGTIEAVTEFADVRGVRSLIEEGSLLRFQLKATIGCRGDAAYVRYDCDARAYNRMVRQNQAVGVRTILLVYCMPSDETQWLSVTDDTLMLRRACYWYYPASVQTNQRRSQVISIPRSQLFTAAALSDIMDRIQAKQNP